MTTETLFSRFGKKVAETFFDTSAKTVGVGIFTLLIGAVALVIAIAQQATVLFLCVVVVVLIGLNLLAIAQIFWIKKARAFKGRNIFWMCGDITHTRGTLAEGNGSQIIDGLRRVHHHIKEAELGEILVNKSQKLKDDAIAVVEWTAQARTVYRERLQTLFLDIAHELARRQPDFKPDPE